MRHAWEDFGDECERLRIPGGWLYRTWVEGLGGTEQQSQVVFVPASATTSDESYQTYLMRRG